MVSNHPARLLVQEYSRPATPAPATPQQLPPAYNGLKFTADEVDVLEWHMKACDQGLAAVRYQHTDTQHKDIHQGVEYYHGNDPLPAYTAKPGQKGAEFHLGVAPHKDALKKWSSRRVAMHGDNLEFVGTLADKQKIDDILRDLHNSPGGLSGPKGIKMATIPTVNHVLPAPATRPQTPVTPPPVPVGP